MKTSYTAKLVQALLENEARYVMPDEERERVTREAKELWEAAQKSCEAVTVLYVVEALRWGDREQHSYVVGVYDTLEAAKNAADEHAQYRGGKYVCVVVQCPLNGQVSLDWSEALMYQTGRV